MALTHRVVWLLLIGAVPVVLRPSVGTVWLWVALVAALVALDLLLAPTPAGLEVARPVRTTRVRLGERAQTEIVIANPTGRGVRGLVRDAWPPSAGQRERGQSLHIPPGERVRVVTHFLPTRRGDRHADRVTIRLRGPLGLAARQSSIEVPGVLRVLHPFGARRHIPSKLAALRQLDGRAALRTRGQGTEFDSLRDYVDGDDVRSLDWRATARRQHPVVRTWRPEEQRRVIIVIDTSRTSAGRIGDVPRLDAGMDAALLLVALAGHARDRVHIIAGDRQVHARITGHDRAELLSAAVDALADVEPSLVEADWSALASEVAQASSQRGLVVLITPLEPSAIEEGLLPVLPALAARHRVVLASVSDPELGRMSAQRDTLAEVYDAVAAERTTQLREATAAGLRRIGVSVIEGDPDSLPPQLADHYLALKSHGLL
ncbi:DUF58 domain-containing protein [Janibacter sp. GXQ6167]|uniref:DUF58 domain-containing protein n=1 Tax=Janibacter sp. GXQ6167 TaxID=3240791 RepID=UPI0035242C32